MGTRKPVDQLYLPPSGGDELFNRQMKKIVGPRARAWGRAYLAAICDEGMRLSMISAAERSGVRLTCQSCGSKMIRVPGRAYAVCVGNVDHGTLGRKRAAVARSEIRVLARRRAIVDLMQGADPKKIAPAMRLAEGKPPPKRR